MQCVHGNMNGHVLTAPGLRWIIVIAFSSKARKLRLRPSDASTCAMLSPWLWLCLKPMCTYSIWGSVAAAAMQPILASNWWPIPSKERWLMRHTPWPLWHEARRGKTARRGI